MYVTQHPWFVSFRTCGAGSAVTLSVHRPRPGREHEHISGDHDGRLFPTVDAAEAFAVVHGYLQPYRRAHAPLKAQHRVWSRGLGRRIRRLLALCGDRADVSDLAELQRERARRLGFDVLQSLIYANGTYAAADRLRPDLRHPA